MVSPIADVSTAGPFCRIVGNYGVGCLASILENMPETPPVRLRTSNTLLQLEAARKPEVFYHKIEIPVLGVHEDHGTVTMSKTTG
jgi:hypothetical protein